MKSRILIATILFLISISSFGTNYYCATTGNDANAGTFVSPFKTWAFMFSKLNAGDTGFVRGGTYTSPLSSGASDWLVTFANKAGTSVKHIVMMAYPGEQPTLDLNGFDQVNNTTVIRVNKCSFVDFIGLWVKNMAQHNNGNGTGSIIAGWEFHECTDITMNRCWVDNIGGAGIRQASKNGLDVINNDRFTYINCDASRCGDAISTGGGAYGNADGFDCNLGTATYTNCRAWWCSDDGFDCFNNDALITYTGCLAFRNGFVPGTFTDPGAQADGMGFKWGSTLTDQSANVLRKYIQCVAFQNKVWAFDQNVARCKAQFYNNTSYNNFFHNTSSSIGGGWATGYSIGPPREASILSNNGSYLDQTTVSDPADLVLTNNSWQVAAGTASTFLSLDTTGISGLRSANGTLPSTNFLHLATNSNWIDRGGNVGLVVCGGIADLGAYEVCTSTSVLTVSPNFTAILCYGGTSTITVGVSGGQPPYQYKLGTGSFGSSNVFSGLIAGTYLITVQDALGAIASQNAFITQPTQITISQVSGTILVNGGSTSTTITATGGSGTLAAKRYKLDASAYQVSNVFSGVLAGTHTITVRDSLLCTNTINYTLIQPTALNLTAVATINPLTCFGNTTTITLTASGGTSPYQYQIDGGAFQSANTFTGRGAGTYTLTVRDAGGALKTATVTITQPSQITITQSSTAIVANGGTATTTVTASGGTSTLNYKLDAGIYQVSNVFTGVTAGAHTITVRDANLCTNTLTYTLTQPSLLVVSAVGGTISCNGGITTITVTASGGTSPYQYSINGGTYQSANTFTSRGAGTYTLTVRDAALVTKTTTLTITQPSQIAIAESHTAISIAGGTSTVTVTASGGTSTLNYSMDGGAYQSSNSFSGILAGTHTVSVRDANLCINTFTFTITQPSTALAVSTALTTAIACNGGTATVTVTATDGTAPYQYQATSAAGTIGYQASNIFTGLVAGTWTFRVRDAAGSIVSSVRGINTPAIIVLSVAVSGSTATATATGGVGSKQYKLDAGAYQSSNVFTAVVGGNHTITVKDANTCTNAKSFTVAGNQIHFSMVVGTILCNGGTTTVAVNATGGTAPYTGTGTFTRAAGTWTFTVTDATAARADTTITISQPTIMSVSVSSGTISVNGGTTTSTVSATGGTGALTYKLDAGTYQSSNVFTVAAGNHIVTVKDANNCTASVNFSLTEPTNLNISIVVGTAIACRGGTTTVTVSGTGGTTPYTYGKNGVFQSATPFTNITAGTYTFSVKDAFNAQHDTIVTITQPAALTLSVATGTISVNGGTTTVTGTGAGGTGSLTYSLDGGAYQGSGVFAGVLAGSHTLRVKDANACITTNSFSISQPDDLVITISRGAAATCYGGTQTITVGSTGGTAPITGTGSFAKLAGTYTFTVTDAFGARADTIITVTQPTQITISVTTGTISVNGGTTTVTATASGGTSTLTYSLDGGGYQGTGSFATVAAGPHTVTVKDANNCTNTNSFSISQPGELLISVSVVTDSLDCNGDSTSITVTASGGTAPYNGDDTYNIGGGTQTITVTDAFGAKADTIITIYEPSKVAVVAIFKTGMSFNSTNISISATGGTGTLQYKLDGGAYQLSNAFTGVVNGNHTITLKDDNNCTGTFNFNISGRRNKKITYIQVQ